MVELLCSVAISLLLLAGVVAMISGSYASYQNADRAAQLEERGWRALDILSRDIRNAGFHGCTRNPRFVGTSLNDADSLPWNFLDSAVRGFQAQEEHWAPASLHEDYIPAASHGSDILLLRIPKRGTDPARVTADMLSPEDNIKVNTPEPGLHAHEIALIYDCEASVYFQASAVSSGVIHHGAEYSAHSPGNSSESLGYAFRAGAEIIPMQTVVYYVREDSPEEGGAKSLWRRVGLNIPERLVESVEQMQLQFGVDVTGDAQIDRYVTADAVNDWEHVYSVSVALLVSLGDTVEQGTESFEVLDETIRAKDERMRRVFSTIVSLRNRAS